MVTKEWLKRTRTILGLTLEDVAKEMSVTRQTLSNVENGKSTKKSTMLFYEQTLRSHIENGGRKPKEG